MDNTRKMVLLPEDSYKYLASQSLRKDPLKTTQTVGSNLTRKDDEMHQILESNLPADEKWKKYEQLFNQYLFYKNPLKRKLNPSYEAASEDEDEGKNSDGLPSEKIVATLPKTMRRNAASFLDFIKAENNQHKITWNERGVVKVNKKEIPGTNIIDIVNDVVRKRQSFSAFGKDAFVQLLKDMSIPREFIGNYQLQEALNKSRNKKANSSKQRDQTLKNDSTLDNFESLLEDSSKVSTPKSVKKSSKTQNGRGWLSLNI